MKLVETLTNYSRMIKLSHTLFALPFAGLSVILAIIASTKAVEALYLDIFWVIACMFTLRSSAMGFNRYIDRDIDSRNLRTAYREIPSGVLSEKSVLFFVVISSLLFIFSTYQINLLCFYLSFPTLFLVLFYSVSKRFTVLCHFILGLAIGLAPTGAWVAIQETIDLVPTLWSLGLLFHIAGFDILYSTQDADFDRQESLYSIPSRYGIPTALWVARFSHVLASLFLLYAGVVANLGFFYFLFLGIALVLFAIEHYMVSPTDLTKVPIAFFHVNASISIVLFIGVLIDRWSLLSSRMQGMLP
jgi:4-hydroxybenzoate polyprenyltransferase